MGEAWPLAAKPKSAQAACEGVPFVAAAASRSRAAMRHARAGGRRVLVVGGEIGAEAGPLLSLAFAGAASAPEPLGVELTDAEIIDDDGIALLVNGLRRLHHRRGEVIVVCPPGRIRLALERAGLAYRMTILDARNGLAGSSLREAPAAPLGPTGFTGHRHRQSTPARRATLLAEATLAIEDRHAEPTLTARDIARQIGTSERQLQRVLQQAGSGFRDEVAAMRMQHAAALLQTTELPVGEVARRVGYRQPAQFAKAFRRHHGSPPTAFRRTISR